jgi:hypothetical protein
VKYTQWMVAGALIALVAAVARPDIAHLALRAVLAVAIVSLSVHLLLATLRWVPPSPFEAAPPAHELSSPELPRDLAGLADELRSRDRYLSENVAVRLAREFAVTLWARHGLSDAALADPTTLSQHLSPTAAALVASSGATYVPRRQLEALLHELEHL